MSKLPKITDNSIAAWEALKSYFIAEDKLFEKINDDENFISFRGKGIINDCYFSIVNQELKSDKISFLIKQKPTSVNNPNESQVWLTPEQLKGTFGQWITFLKKYEELSQIFKQDEVLEDRFTQDFFQEFEYIDDDATILSVQDILKLDNTFEILKVKLLEYKDTFVIETYNEIQEEIEKTQKELTTISKKGLAYKISKIQALIFKQGPKFLKETGVDIVKAVIVEIIKVKMIG
jgi:hypothetical protein